MGGIFKKSIIAFIGKSFFASWLGIAVRSIAHEKGAEEIYQESVKVVSDSMIEYMAQNSKSQADLAQERVLFRRDLQDVAVEDVQDNVNDSSTTLNALGTRRHWFYSILIAAQYYYGQVKRQLTDNLESWPVKSLKLGHPIDDTHGPLRKNFDRAVYVFKAVMDSKPNRNATLELSKRRLDEILRSDGSMWGIPWPGTDEIVIMNGNGRVAGLKWACLSECFREEGLSVKVPVVTARSQVPQVSDLLGNLINGLYTCSDLSKQYTQLVDYWQTGAGCRAGPSFGACANGKDVVSSDGKVNDAWASAEPCMQRLSDVVNNTLPAGASVNLPACDWKGLMRFLKRTEYQGFLSLYRTWVRTGEPDEMGAYQIDCVYEHADECESKGLNVFVPETRPTQTKVKRKKRRRRDAECLVL